MRFGAPEIIVFSLSITLYAFIFYYLNKHTDDDQTLRHTIRSRSFQLMLSGDFIMFIGGLTLGIGGLIISIPFLILLGYLAVLANRSPLNGNVFALIFAIILIGQRSILYFGGGYPDIQSWIIVIFYLGAAIYVLPSSIILIKSGVATGWR